MLTITKVTSAAAHASAAVAASVAPASTRGWHAAAVRFHTVSSCPAFIRFKAMGTPFVFVFVESCRVAGRQGDEAVSVENAETLG